MNPSQSITNLLKINKFEDFSHKNIKENIMVDEHVLVTGLIGTIHKTFDMHYALKLTVSDITIAIGQGLGHHINENSKKLQKYFVKKTEKEKIEIRRDNFILGEQNDWSDTFADFSSEIKKIVPEDFYDIIIDNSSISTPTSRIASEINLMNTMKSYCDFSCAACCGIPEIILVGSKEDWENLQGKVNKLNKLNSGNCLDLDFWLEFLNPVIESICETAINKTPTKDFWNHIYKLNNESGGPYITGWCNVLVPYTMSEDKTYNRNINLFWENIGEFAGLPLDMIPPQYCEVPFVWNYHQKYINMNIHSGFLGTHYNENEQCLL